LYVDVTPSDEARNEEVAEHRAAIEQTKGMLIVIYRMTADTAFEHLKWRSQKTNTTHPRSAALGRVPVLPYDATLPPRTTYDRLFLTAHIRIWLGQLFRSWPIPPIHHDRRAVVGIELAKVPVRPTFRGTRPVTAIIGSPILL
jgi:hypothetical protein